MAAIALAATFLSAISSAHPGGLDAKGCHTNKKTGEYHCHRPQADAATQPAYAAPTNSNNRDGTVKMSKSGICHSPSSPWYTQTTHYTPYPNMDACIKAGGRPPKG